VYAGTYGSLFKGELPPIPPPPDDGNSDGTPDDEQPNVESVYSATGNYITLAAPDGVTLQDLQVADPPVDPPLGADLPQGTISFAADGVSVGGSFTVTLIVQSGTTADGYWKYGPTPSDPSDHWYEFAYDGTTGAQVSGNIITLHFVDGGRGDSDLVANGSITDPGGTGTRLRTFIYLPIIHD
jgi:hypothetical protein